LLKIRVWTKVVLLGLVAIYTLLFIFLNTGQSIDVWLFFGVEPRMSVLLALAGAFVLGSLVTLLVRTVVKTVQQVKVARERGRTQRMEREIADMRTKASSLQSRK
jgi:uncharacterized integral membrane protein